MKTIKVSEAIGPVLDWLVAKCEGAFDLQRRECFHNRPWFFYMRDDDEPDIVRHTYLNEYEPSTDWAQGGQIIEREEIGVKRNAPCSDGRQWEASPSITAKGAGGRWGYGPTPLIAAMRCYVASRMGNEVEVPEELG